MLLALLLTTLLFHVGLRLLTQTKQDMMKARMTMMETTEAVTMEERETSSSEALASSVVRGKVEPLLASA